MLQLVPSSVYTTCVHLTVRKIKIHNKNKCYQNILKIPFWFLVMVNVTLLIISIISFRICCVSNVFEILWAIFRWSLQSLCLQCINTVCMDFTSDFWGEKYIHTLWYCWCSTFLFYRLYRIFFCIVTADMECCFFYCPVYRP